MKGDVGEGVLHSYRLPIHDDSILFRVGFLAQRGCPPVHKNPSLANQFLAVSAGTEASAGQNLL
jgi:hypothetical protein